MVSSRTLVIKIDPDKPDKDVIAYSAGVIRSGGIVAFPTETVYGLAVNMLDDKAIKKLYRIKSRSRGKPFTVHIADVGLIKKMGCRVTGTVGRLIKKFWPGPLTIILNSKGGKSVGFRMPANTAALELISASGVPVAAPSANISGRKPPTSARGALKDLDGKIDIVLDAGRTKVGIESTVIDMTVSPPAILREGAISSRMLRKVLNSR
ncbi:MAG: L-threonylcarbamoyladenylate synthase [Candidatus Omnitrophica bacterium]|nr:L-threonylcarbamoyladenylate synthase [Candidatus Omnitrophota bacterium]